MPIAPQGHQRIGERGRAGPRSGKACPPQRSWHTHLGCPNTEGSQFKSPRSGLHSGTVIPTQGHQPHECTCHRARAPGGLTHNSVLSFLAEYHITGVKSLMVLTLGLSILGLAFGVAKFENFEPTVEALKSRFFL